MRSKKIASLGYVIVIVVILGAFVVPYSIGASQTYQYWYKVQSGDTLSLIGSRFNVAWQNIASVNHIYSPYYIYVGEVLQIPLSSPSVSYTVKSGDSLSAIASKFEISWQSIASANHISSPYIIYVGEVLTIPLVTITTTTTSSTSSSSYVQSSSSYVQYTVKSGDTLYSISQVFGVQWQSIATLNNIQSPYTIYVGEKLLIPTATATTSSSSSSTTSSTSLSTTTDSSISSTTITSTTSASSSTSTIDTTSTTSSSTVSSSSSSSSTSTSSTALRGSWVWLWENYSSGLSAIAAHSGAITVVSPNTYTLLDNGSFALVSSEAEICPQVHSIGLQCVPLIQNDQYSPAGINTLLTNASLQSTFIQSAVKEAVNQSLDGYNVDFEPSYGTLNVSNAYGIFLTNFANAMHAKNKTLSVDMASWDGGALWNYSIEASSSVDIVLTMVTYNSNYTTFQQGVQAMLQNVPLDKIAIGLLTVSDDATLTQRIQYIESYNIPNVMVWPSYPGFLTDIWWGNLTSYVQSG
ncbi:MAG: LysM peptidoglycan-binding domain-containing protein [Nitrososphaerales archaeon]